MKQFFIPFIIMLICLTVLSSFSNAQSNMKRVPSGFYQVSKTEDISNGFLLKKDQTYYTLSDDDFLPFNVIDSVYDEFMHSTFSVIIVLKPYEKKTLHSFTKHHKDQDIGLVVNGELLLVARVVEPIANGSISYSGTYNKAHVKHIEAAIRYALRKGEE